MMCVHLEKTDFATNVFNSRELMRISYFLKLITKSHQHAVCNSTILHTYAHRENGFPTHVLRILNRQVLLEQFKRHYTFD